MPGEQPRFPEARAQVLFKSGGYDELAAACRSFLVTNPGDTKATYYLSMTLAKLGFMTEARDLVSLDRYLDVGSLARPPSFKSGSAFLAGVAEEILRNPSLVADPRAKSTRKGRQTRHLRQADAPCVEALLGQIKLAVDGYISRLPGNAGDFAKACPQQADLNAWAVVSGADGHHKSHVHLGAWLSGVFNVAGVRRAGEGTYKGPLVVGVPPEASGLIDPPWGTREIEPVPGRIVMFPSYIPHATSAPGHRRPAHRSRV